MVNATTDETDMGIISPWESAPLSALPSLSASSHYLFVLSPYPLPTTLPSPDTPSSFFITLDFLGCLSILSFPVSSFCFLPLFSSFGAQWPTCLRFLDSFTFTFLFCVTVLILFPLFISSSHINPLPFPSHVAFLLLRRALPLPAPFPSPPSI